MPWLALVLGAVVAPGCGLTLDYDPPTDGGVDVRGIDAGIDAGTDGGGPECRTDVDCDDDDPCTGIEQCQAGVCAEGIAVDCDDHNACNGDEVCDPGTGTCPTPAPIACPDDGNPCNGVAFCDPLIGCVYTPAIECDDGVPCTTDFCEPSTGDCAASGSDAACMEGPGGRCTPTGCEYDTCNETICRAGSPPCFEARCEMNRCVRTPSCAVGMECCDGACIMPCVDDNLCTRDVCRAGLGCVHEPTFALCDDGDACTTGDRCDTSGACRPGGRTFCPGLDECNVGICAGGLCGTEQVTGTPCSDGDACTIGDSCTAGVCMPGSATPSCFDAGPCTGDVCDPALGCLNPVLPDGTPCSTLLGAGTCTSGMCVAGVSCRPGTFDCDGDDVCDCTTGCVIGPGGPMCARAGDCRVMGCGPMQNCCSDPGSSSQGSCYPALCTGCCMAMTM